MTDGTDNGIVPQRPINAQKPPCRSLLAGAYSDQPVACSFPPTVTRAGYFHTLPCFPRRKRRPGLHRLQRQPCCRVPSRSLIDPASTFHFITAPARPISCQPLAGSALLPPTRASLLISLCDPVSADSTLVSSSAPPPGQHLQQLPVALAPSRSTRPGTPATERASLAPTIQTADHSHHLLSSTGSCQRPPGT